MARDITTVIEEAMIAELEKTGIFKKIESLGRFKPSPAKTYPLADLFFSDDNDATDSDAARPVPDFYYIVRIYQKNLTSEKSAARDAYSIMDEVRDLFNGKVLGIEGIEPIRLVSRKIMRYRAGEIVYDMRFRIPVVLAPIR